MALSYAHGAIQWLSADVATTTYTVSGLSFQPKALRFSWCGLQSATDAVSGTVNQSRGIGVAVSTSSRRCVGSFSQDTAAMANCGTVARDDAIACTTDGAGGSDGELDLNSITSDGFTLIVDDAAPQNITVFWEAWGGTDITVAVVGDIAEPAATGNQDYTATGFVAGATDQVVMLAGVQSIAAVNTAEAEASGFYIGYATGSGAAQNVVTGNSDDGSATMDTDGYARGDECVAMITLAGVAAGGAVEAKASLTQFGTDNFRLNWATVGRTNRRSIFLAIKGGQWSAGDFTLDCTTINNTATVSGLAFAPIGVSFISGATTTEDVSNTARAFDKMNWGCASSTSSRRGMFTKDRNAVADAEIYLGLDYDAILIEVDNTGALLQVVDMNAFNSDGFQVIVDDPDAGASAVGWIGYLAFASAAVADVFTRKRTIVVSPQMLVTPAVVGYAAVFGAAAALLAPLPQKAIAHTLTTGTGQALPQVTPRVWGTTPALTAVTRVGRPIIVVPQQYADLVPYIHGTAPDNVPRPLLRTIVAAPFWPDGATAWLWGPQPDGIDKPSPRTEVSLQEQIGFSYAKIWGPVPAPIITVDTPLGRLLTTAPQIAQTQYSLVWGTKQAYLDSPIGKFSFYAPPQQEIVQFGIHMGQGLPALEAIPPAVLGTEWIIRARRRKGR